VKPDLLQTEAILFAYGRWVSGEELQQILGLTSKKLKSQLASLQESYVEKETSLQLVQQNNQWKLTVKDQYLELVKNIVTKTELDRPTLETLGVIAFNYPILQSDVIHQRGGGAYEHIKALSEMGYVIKERFGRSYKLKLTPKFFEYFDLPKDKIKEVFSEFEDLAKSITVAEDKAEEIRLQEKELEKQQQQVLEAKKENKQLSQFKE